MSFESTVTTRAALALIAVGLAWTATAFLALAVFFLLAPQAGIAGAAVMTGLVLLLVLGIGMLAYLAASGRQAAQTQAVAAAPAGAKRESFLSASAAPLAMLAKDHPLLAVGCAAVLGMADSIQAENHRD